MTRRPRYRWARHASSFVIVVASAAIAYANGQIEIAGDTHDLTTSDQVTIVGSGQLTAALILTPNPFDAFAFVATQAGDTCMPNGLSCTYSNRPLASMPQFLTIACERLGPGMASAMLRVEGTNPVVDFDEEMIFCTQGMATDEAFTVSPDTVSVGDVPVGTSSSGHYITITNRITQPYPLALGSLPVDWSVDCATPCILMGLETKEIPVRLTPSALGPRDASVTISGGANGFFSEATVILRGNGVASPQSLDVTIPAGPVFNLDMGPVPLSGGMRTLRLRYTGSNASQSVSITSSDSERVSVTNNTVPTPPGDTDIVVTCRSPMPDEVFETLFIQPTPAVAQNTMSVNVLCSVTNASVTLDPTELDFGDVVRQMEPVEPIDLILMARNTGVTTVQLDDFEILSTAPLATLSLVSPPVGDLIPGGVATVTVRMTPNAAERYGDTTKLTFTVDGVALEVPITGRVTTQSGRIDPTEALDLGTACVGRPITGTIRLTNDGTAPIEMMAPVITGPFTSTYDPDVTFPAEVPEGAAQDALITTSETSGSLEGTFTWVGDVGPFALDLRAQYIADGTAVSPQTVDFAVIDVDATTAPRTVTLENCNSVPSTLSVESVVSRQGPARAWLVEPALETTTLEPGERYTVMVRFAPTTPGQHLAELPFIVDGARTTVVLSGFADGELLQRTSFYACTCSGGGSVVGGWPLLLVLVPLRRRRLTAARARSARSRQVGR